ncbi:MAG: YafY family protein [Myxococcota bacterium]
MARAPRLLSLLDALHRRRAPVSGAALAAELGVSLRTGDRDIATLQEQGAQIEGEAGIGYVLRPGYLLPPLTFPDAELDAIALGLRWVADRGDPTLADAARAALGRIGAALPPERRAELWESALVVGPSADLPETRALPVLRGALRDEHKVRIRYADGAGAGSERVVWPIALAFMDRVRILVGWCELRAGFRHFRADRITELEVLAERYPRRRRSLVREWRVAEGIDR